MPLRMSLPPLTFLRSCIVKMKFSAMSALSSPKSALIASAETQRPRRTGDEAPSEFSGRLLCFLLALLGLLLHLGLVLLQHPLELLEAVHHHALHQLPGHLL